MNTRKMSKISQLQLFLAFLFSIYIYIYISSLYGICCPLLQFSLYFFFFIILFWLGELLSIHESSKQSSLDDEETNDTLHHTKLPQSVQKLSFSNILCTLSTLYSSIRLKGFLDFILETADSNSPNCRKVVYLKAILCFKSISKYFMLDCFMSKFVNLKLFYL